MKTSLGIRAFGPLITRVVPGGRRPVHGDAARDAIRACELAVAALGA